MTSIQGNMRLRRAAIIVVTSLLVPGLVGLLLAGPTGAAGLAIGTVGSLLIYLRSGHVPSPSLIIAMASAFALGGLSRDTWLWVLVTTTFAFTAGWQHRAGLLPAYAMITLVSVSAMPLGSVSDAATGAAFVVAGGWFGSRLAVRAVPPPPMPEPAGRQAAPVAGLAFGGAMAVASTAAIGIDAEFSYWIPLTVVVLAIPITADRRRLALHRVLGTVAGLIVLAPVAVAFPHPATVALLALGFLVLAVAFPEPAWLRFALMTATITTIAAPDRNWAAVAERRLLFTLAGIVILLAAGAVADRVLDRIRRGVQPHDSDGTTTGRTA